MFNISVSIIHYSCNITEAEGEVGRIVSIVVHIKCQNMKKVFHKIYWNLANLTGDAAGETYAFVYAKHEVTPLSRNPKLIFTSFNH